MKLWKKLVSMTLALAMCLGLLATASLAGEVGDCIYKGGYLRFEEVTSGDGWSFDWETRTLTLNNLTCETIFLEGDYYDVVTTIVLAEGSVNTVGNIEFCGSLTVKGSGTLILDSNGFYDAPLYGSCAPVFTVEAPLTMTGGSTPEAREPLTVQTDHEEYEDGYSSDDVNVYLTSELGLDQSQRSAVTYVVIAPGAAAPASRIAYGSTQTVDVGGKKVELQAYALKDANGNSTNYVKIRDIADVLDGTAAQFNVGWDGAVNIEAGKPYTTRNGQEHNTPYAGDQPYTGNTSPIKLNGSAVSLDSFVITWDGAGSTYFKLRDLGQALGFNVGWSAERGMFIEPDKPYNPND